MGRRWPWYGYGRFDIAGSQIAGRPQLIFLLGLCRTPTAPPFNMVELVCEQTSLLLDWSATIGGLKRNFATGVQHQRMQFDGFDIDHGKQHAVVQ